MYSEMLASAEEYKGENEAGGKKTRLSRFQAA
jgi:hypothetical protein